MKNETIETKKHLFVVLNPVAGHSDSDLVRQSLEKHTRERGWSFEIYETTGEEDVAEVARKACRQGAGLVAAAGGDGTVAGVINGLVHETVPLGVIPLGTGNGLARALSIPLDPDEAIQVLLGEHEIQPLDAMRAGGRYFILNVSAGISSRSMSETEAEEKQSKGMLAYVETIVKDVAQAESSVYRLTLDGRPVRVRAAEVLVANGTVLKSDPVIFGSREFYSDGQVEVNILTAEDAADYARLVWDLLLDRQEESEMVHDLAVRERIRIEVEGDPLPVQADGEDIGHTPVEVEVVPGALRVVLPEAEKETQEGVES